MNVTELTRDQLAYLKECLYYDSETIPEMTSELRKAIDKAQIPEEIPNALVFEIFTGIDFVEDDFPTSRKPKITIIVKDGRVESVYSTELNVVIEVIDLDTEDNEEYDSLMESVQEAQENQYLVY